MIRLLGLAAALSSVLPGAVAPAEFAERRAKIRATLNDSALVLYARSDKEAEDNRDGYFQEPNFFYLTGIPEAGGVLLVTPEGDRLYLNPRDPKIEKWHGRRLALEDDVKASTGLEARPLEKLTADLRESTWAKLYTLPSTAVQLKSDVPERETPDAAPMIARLRMTKSAAELDALKKAVAATIAGHRASWQVTRPGLYEYELASRLTGTYTSMGCQRNAFPPIVGSGPNGVVLHYSRNNRRMDAGELVVVDAGAECDAYAGDITRTIPVNGKFTARQRQLYEAVLEAERAVIAAAKPGVTVKQLKQVALDSLDAKGKDLAKYLTHGVSHHVGLEVHDASDNDAPLTAGAVITVEPGVYVPEEATGIRIEDMLLITQSGAQLLSGGLPVDAEAIEREMARRKP